MTNSTTSLRSAVIPALEKSSAPSQGAVIPAEAGIHEKSGVKGNPHAAVYPLRYQPDEQVSWVYILTNKPNGTLYIGVTNNLPRRMHEHCQGMVAGFTQKHGLKILVYFEGYPSHTQSIAREKAMKNWSRAWKVRRILETNPEWRDLAPELV